MTQCRVSFEESGESRKPVLRRLAREVAQRLSLFGIEVTVSAPYGVDYQVAAIDVEFEADPEQIALVVGTAKLYEIADAELRVWLEDPAEE